jgi:N utilization substance protein A
VVVADDQLSLAIGKKGQNVRLASKLTGWKIDIKSESKMEKISTEILERFKGLPHIGDVASRILYNEGFRSVKDVGEVDPEELAKIIEIEKEKAGEIVEAALGMSEEQGEGEVRPETPGGQKASLDPVRRMAGVGEKTAAILEANGFKTIQNILNANVEALSALPGIGTKRAEKLIQSAQSYVEGSRA